MNIKEKRRKILCQIDEYNTQRCSKCIEVGAYDAETVNCNCRAAVAIRKLGDELLKLVSPRSDEAENETSVMMEMLNTPEDITPKIYRELKRLKVPDKLIRKKIGLSENRFNIWKSENGLRKTYKKSEVN